MGVVQELERAERLGFFLGVDPLSAVTLVCAVFATAFAVVAVAALRRRQRLGSLLSVLTGLLLLALAALTATISIATQGYQVLTREEVAVTAEIRPTGPQQFDATFVFPDAARQTFRLAGDQFYIDAHILKWKPLANWLGLHTTYELDRVGGRYNDIEHERSKTRTLFSLKEDKAMDMFSLRRRHQWLSALLDAEYGSATFIAVDQPAAFEVRVSTSGLLIRPAETQAKD